MAFSAFFSRNQDDRNVGDIWGTRSDDPRKMNIKQTKEFFLPEILQLSCIFLHIKQASHEINCSFQTKKDPSVWVGVKNNANLDKQLFPIAIYCLDEWISFKTLG
jgi:hypothetical protein